MLRKVFLQIYSLIWYNSLLHKVCGRLLIYLMKLYETEEYKWISNHFYLSMNYQYHYSCSRGNRTSLITKQGAVKKKNAYNFETRFIRFNESIALRNVFRVFEIKIFDAICKDILHLMLLLGLSKSQFTITVFWRHWQCSEKKLYRKNIE